MDMQLSWVQGSEKPVLKVRRKKKGLQLHPERTHHREIRFLPPGTIKDYYEQFCASEQCRISFRAFWKCWNTEFSSFCGLDRHPSHAQCGVCCHHKVNDEGTQPIYLGPQTTGQIIPPPSVKPIQRPPEILGDASIQPPPGPRSFDLDLGRDGPNEVPNFRDRHIHRQKTSRS